MQLKTKLQLGVVIPLFVAILLCSIVTLIVLGVQHRAWFDRLHDYIVEEEQDNLDRRAQTKAFTVAYFYNSVGPRQRIRALRFFSGVVDSYLEATLELNEEYTYDASALNAYDTIGVNYSNS
jgi:hypothetical protein